MIRSRRSVAANNDPTKSCSPRDVRVRFNVRGIRRGAVVGGITAVALVASACGSSSSTATTSPPTTSGSAASASGGNTSSGVGTQSYSWSSLPASQLHKELAAIGLDNVNYGVYKGKTVGVAELAPIEPVTRIEADFNKCVSDNGGTVRIVDTGGDPQKGIAAIQNFQQQKVAAIFNNALDPSTIKPELTTANKERLPVVTMWSGTTAQSVGINGLEGQSAAQLAQYVIDKLHGTGNVVMLGSTATQSLRQRDAGFLNAIKEYPGIKVVANQSVDVASPTENANSAMKAILQGNPNVDAVWTDFDEIGAGAAQAIDQTTTQGTKPFVVSFNGDTVALKDIRDPNSSFAATMSNDLQVSGDVACAEIADMLAKKTIPAQNIYMESPLVTKENVPATGYAFGSGPFVLYAGPAAQRWPS